MIYVWLPWWLREVSKESACNAWDLGSIPGSGGVYGEGMANHPSILAWDRGAWQATVHGVAKESDTTQRLNHHHHRWLAQDDTAYKCWDQSGRFLVPGSSHIKLCQFAACLHISPGLCTKPPNLVSLLLSLQPPPSYTHLYFMGTKATDDMSPEQGHKSPSKRSLSQWLQTLQTLCWYGPQPLEYG